MNDFSPEALIEAMAPLNGLTIAPEWKPQIALHLAIAAAHAAKVLALSLPDEEEPAPVFAP